MVEREKVMEKEEEGGRRNGMDGQVTHSLAHPLTSVVYSHLLAYSPGYKGLVAAFPLAAVILVEKIVGGCAFCVCGCGCCFLSVFQ